jgi:hypothetical protein
LSVGGDEIAVHLRRGRLAAVASERLPYRLGRVLCQAGAITDAQLRDALRVQAAGGGTQSLGELIVSRGWTTRERLAACVHEQAVAALARALGARAGSFSWSPGVASPSQVATADIDPRLVLLDAIRRLDELRQLRDQLPPRDAALAVAAWVDATNHVANDLEIRILGLMRAGIASWGELVELLPIDEAGVLRAIASLVRRHIIVAPNKPTDGLGEVARLGTGALSESDLCVLLEPARAEV